MKEDESADTDSIPWDIVSEGICNELKKNLENSCRANLKRSSFTSASLST